MTSRRYTGSVGRNAYFGLSKVADSRSAGTGPLRTLATSGFRQFAITRAIAALKIQRSDRRWPHSALMAGDLTSVVLLRCFCGHPFLKTRCLLRCVDVLGKRRTTAENVSPEDLNFIV